MNEAETLQLQAFLLALARLDVALSPELRQTIHRFGQALSQAHPLAQLPLTQPVLAPPSIAKEASNPSTVIAAIVQQHYRLQELYDSTHQHLNQEAEIQERAKHLIHTDRPPSQQLTWEAVAGQILTADDFKAAAVALVRQVKSDPDPSYLTGDIRVFLVHLQRAIVEWRSQATALLKALEKRPLRLKDLSIMTGMTFDQVTTIAQLWWQRGYIDRASGSLLYNLVPIALWRPPTRDAIDPEIYLTLTSKGHFFLHPVLRWRNRQFNPKPF